MTTAHSFNQVFFHDVRLPADLLVGEENHGWQLARATLANERVSLSSGGALWGSGPSARDLVALTRARGRITDPLARERLAAVYAEGEVLRLIQLRTLSSRVAGREPGPYASVQKVLSDEHGQRVMGLAKELAGTDGMLVGSGPPGQLPPETRHGPHRGELLAGALPRCRPGVALRVPLLPGADDRWRHLGGPTQHHRRDGSSVCLATREREGQRSDTGPELAVRCRV